MSSEAFEKTVGKWYDFYGVDNNCFKLGTRVFEAIENPDDGYRSYLDSVERKDATGLIFFPNALARVKVVAFDERNDTDPDRGYRLVDKSGHVWLTFGTDRYDDYYPTFVFHYQPKPS